MFGLGRVNKCLGGMEATLDLLESKAARQRARNRLRKALRLCGLPWGVDDDQYMDFDECGVRLGNWTLCYTEDSVTGRKGVFLISDRGDEHVLSDHLPNSVWLAHQLRTVVNEYELWDQLKPNRGN